MGNVDARFLQAPHFHVEPLSVFLDCTLSLKKNKQRFCIIYFGVNSHGSKGKENLSNQDGVKYLKSHPLSVPHREAILRLIIVSTLVACFVFHFCVPSPPLGSAFQAGPVV